MVEKTFTIRCTMEERWIPEFLAMLQTMEGWGHLGHSGLIGFFADGDGDFHPEFDSFEFDNLNSKNVISIPRKETIERYKDSATLIQTSPLAIPEVWFDAG